MYNVLQWLYQQNWFAGRKRLVAQPGGQMMGFALHLYQYDTASNSDRNSTALRSCVHSFYRTICTDAGGAWLQSFKHAQEVDTTPRTYNDNLGMYKQHLKCNQTGLHVQSRKPNFSQPMSEMKLPHKEQLVGCHHNISSFIIHFIYYALADAYWDFSD